MSEIILKCINHVISVVNTPDISSGNVNYDTVLFELCPNWTDYTKTAVFYRTEDEAYYQLLDSDNRCTIPKEVLREKGKIYIGLFGVNGDKTITSDVITYKVREGAITTGLKPSDPTPDIYAQLIGQYINLGAEIDVERKRIDSIVSGATVDANAELIDIRVGADGTVYDSAGDAVRSQFKKIKEVNSLAIVNEASGKEIIATDSSDNVFKNLKVYGETTQKLGKNLIKCDAPPMGIGNDGITYKGVYETPIGGGELQYIEVSGIMTPLNMNNGIDEVVTSYKIGEVTLGAGEYIFSQGFSTGTRYPHLLLFLDGVEHSNLLTAPEKSFTLTKSTVVRLDIEILAMPDSEIPTTKVYPMIRLASETDGTYEPYNGVYPTPENPKEVKCVEGKNELDCSGLVPQTTAGITFTPVYENGLLKYINVNGTATANAYYEGKSNNIQSGSYVLSGFENPQSTTYRSYLNSGGVEIASDVRNNGNFNITSDSDIVFVIKVSSGVKVNNVKCYPMIRDASIKDGTYTPYNCVGFTASGKNELQNTASNIERIGLTYTMQSDGSVKVVGTTTEADYQVLIGQVDLPAGSYILSGAPSNICRLRIAKGTNSTLLGHDLGAGFSFTLDEPSTVFVSVRTQSTVGTKINAVFYPMIRRASITDDTYESYKRETADLSGIELHGLGDARDYIDMERGVIVRKCGVDTFDGSEDEMWYTTDTNTANIKRPAINSLKGKIKNPQNNSEVANMRCTRFMILSANKTYVLNEGLSIQGVGDGQGQLQIYYEKFNTNDVSLWKAHLQANPMTIVYELETPIEEPLSDANLQALRELHSYKPTTVLTNDAGAYMDLEYVADTKLYIDKRISELATAILNN